MVIQTGVSAYSRVSKKRTTLVATLCRLVLLCIVLPGWMYWMYGETAAQTQAPRGRGFFQHPAQQSAGRPSAPVRWKISQTAPSPVIQQPRLLPFKLGQLAPLPGQQITPTGAPTYPAIAGQAKGQPGPAQPPAGGQPQPQPGPQTPSLGGTTPYQPFGPLRTRLPLLGQPGCGTNGQQGNRLGSIPVPTDQQKKDFKRIVKGVIDPQNTLDLIQGIPRLIILKNTPTRIQVGDESIMVYNQLEEQQLTVMGRQVGTTVFNMWFEDPKDKKKETILSYLVRVFPNPNQKKQLEQIYDALAKEINCTFPDSIVRLKLVGDKLVVKGQAKDIAEGFQILRLVRANAPPEETARLPFDTVNLTVARVDDPTAPTLSPTLEDFRIAGGPNVINLLRIPGEHQVMLKVTVAEINRTAARSIGLNFSITNDSGLTVFQNLTGGVGSGGGAGAGAGLGGAGLAGAGGGGTNNLPVNLDNGQISLAINALKNLDYARVLVEPNLTTMNGQTATFLAGGQFPVPVVSGGTFGGLQGISFVPFGVQLAFTPYITDRNRIRLSMSATVSTRDVSTGSNLGAGAGGGAGGFIPGLNTRNFQTTVELRDGETLAVAGLVQNNLGANSERVPFLGDLPLVGHLTGRTRTSMGDQELVVLVQPVLVHPLRHSKVPKLPGSDVFEPSDLEFYLLGRIESRRAYDYRSTIRTDFHRMQAYYHCENYYIFGPHGHGRPPFDAFGEPARCATTPLDSAPSSRGSFPGPMGFMPSTGSHNSAGSVFGSPRPLDNMVPDPVPPQTGSGTWIPGQVFPKMLPEPRSLDPDAPSPTPPGNGSSLVPPMKDNPSNAPPTKNRPSTVPPTKDHVSAGPNGVPSAPPEIITSQPLLNGMHPNGNIGGTITNPPPYKTSPIPNENPAPDLGPQLPERGHDTPIPNSSTLRVNIPSRGKTTPPIPVRTNTSGHSQVPMNNRNHISARTNTSGYSQVYPNTKSHTPVRTNGYSQVYPNTKSHTPVRTKTRGSIQVRSNPSYPVPAYTNQNGSIQGRTSPSNLVPVQPNTSGDIPMHPNTGPRTPVRTNTKGHIPVQTNTSGSIQVQTNTSSYIPVPPTTGGHIPMPLNTNNHISMRTTTSKPTQWQPNTSGLIQVQTNTVNDISVRTNTDSHIPVPSNTGGDILMQPNTSGNIPVARNPVLTVPVAPNPGFHVPLPANPSSRVPVQSNNGTNDVPLPRETNPAHERGSVYDSSYSPIR